MLHGIIYKLSRIHLFLDLHGDHHGSWGHGTIIRIMHGDHDWDMRAHAGNLQSKKEVGKTFTASLVKLYRNVLPNIPHIVV